MHCVAAFTVLSKQPQPHILQRFSFLYYCAAKVMWPPYSGYCCSRVYKAKNSKVFADESDIFLQTLEWFRGRAKKKSASLHVRPPLCFAAAVCNTVAGYGINACFWQEAATHCKTTRLNQPAAPLSDLQPARKTTDQREKTDSTVHQSIFFYP